MYLSALKSLLVRTSEEWYAPIIAWLFGFILAQQRPADNAIVRKAEFIAPLSGRPKDMLLTPRTVASPRRSFTSLIALSVSRADSGAALTVMARQSTMRSSRLLPAFR